MDAVLNQCVAVYEDGYAIKEIIVYQLSVELIPIVNFTALKQSNLYANCYSLAGKLRK